MKRVGTMGKKKKKDPLLSSRHPQRANWEMFCKFLMTPLMVKQMRINMRNTHISDLQIK